jgi:vancomycin resistance protein YoaR
VFTPSVDLRFDNDLDTPLLIQTQVDLTNSKLFFRFYGRPTGRKVTMDGPITSNPVEAGDPVIESDPSLPAGARVRVDRPHDGIDVTLHRVIEFTDGTVTREEISTQYQPWPARYLVGPPE